MKNNLKFCIALIFLIEIVCTSHYFFQNPITQSFSTAITRLEGYDSNLNPDNSIIISLEIEIWHKTIIPYFLTPCIPIEFECDNESYTFKKDGALGGCPTGIQFLILKPGINSFNASLMIEVVEKNITHLPFGNYYFWINQGNFVKSNLLINENGSILTNEKLPDNWGTITDYNTPILISSMVVFCSFYQISKKRPYILRKKTISLAFRSKTN